MSKKKTLTIKALSGNTIEVDISDEACFRFGFRHGDEFIDPKGKEGTAMGVCVAGLDDRETLWYIRKGCKKAIHCGYGNLRERGAKLKGEEKKK